MLFPLINVVNDLEEERNGLCLVRHSALDPERYLSRKLALLAIFAFTSIPWNPEDSTHLLFGSLIFVLQSDCDRWGRVQRNDTSALQGLKTNVE
jgi:hypothetical protein